LLIDFHTDTISTVEDTVLIRETYHIIDTSSTVLLNDNAPKLKLDTNARSVISASAESGCPEALCLLGRCFEHGINVRKDLILAGVYYLRAMHLESYRAPALLWKMMNTEEFTRELELQTSNNNPDAFYVWSGLTSIGFNKLLNEKQAFDLLQRAAFAGHIPAMVELGSCYFTGRWTKQSHDKALELWEHASALGSTEADIRLAAANVLGQINTQDINTAISILRETSKQGSLFSDLTLAYCSKKGIGMLQNKGEAYRIFHKSMQRGSETAFHALRNMHDEIRPQDIEFQMAD
jgi:TPR repeat protein